VAAANLLRKFLAADGSIFVAVGLLWEREGGGLFVIVEQRGDTAPDMRQQLEAKLAAASSRP
jgi:hypothetical protein